MINNFCFVPSDPINIFLAFVTPYFCFFFVVFISDTDIFVKNKRRRQVYFAHELL